MVSHNPEMRSRMRMVMALDRAAWVLEYAGRRVSWGDVADGIAALDRLLEAFGLAAEAPIGVVGRNRPGQAMVLMGLLSGTHPLVILNPVQPAKALAAEVASLRLPAIVAEAQDWTVELVAAAERAGALGFVVDADELTLHPHPNLTALGAGPFHHAAPGTGFEIQTSGTTGAPKRLAMPRTMVQSAMEDGLRSEKSGSGLGLKRSPAFLFVPVVHTSGMFTLTFSFFEGRPVVLFDRFDVAAFRAAVEKHRPRFLSLLPPMIRMILDAEVPREVFTGVVGVRCGTAPLGVETQRRFQDRYGVPVLINYGATEFVGTVAGWTMSEHHQFGEAKLSSVGRARRGYRLRVVDADTGTELPPGETGVLEIGSGTPPDWARTTDLASLDADGFLFIHGRADDAIIRGGFMVLAEEVAQVLRQHPDISEVVVLGVDDARLGQVPVALVERHAGRVLDEDEVRRFCREHLAPYKVPARLVFVDRLPRTPSRKVNRPAARAMLGS